MSERTKVAFLGLGAMGRRMAARLASAGHDVAGWNRSGPPVAAPASGWRVGADLRSVVSVADVVFSMVRDDDASRAVWLAPEGGALGAARAGSLVVECSTLSPAWVSELAGRARDAGLDFLEAPVVGSRPQAEAGNLAFLTGGDEGAVGRARPLLASMGGAVHHLGAPPAGAYGKLIVNALFGVQVATLAELLAFAETVRLEPAALLGALEGLPVLGPSAKGAAASMLARRFEPMFPVALASKDVRYVLEAAERAGAPLPVTRRAGEVFEAGVARGLADENLTAVAKLYA